MNTFTTIRIAAALAALSPNVHAQTPSFEGLGAIPGTSEPWSEARGISADGRTVTGYARQPAHEFKSQPFLWTAETGMVSRSEVISIVSPSASGRAWRTACSVREP